MGGLGPGIGGLEYLVIAIVALVVVGPERLPGLLRTLGQWVAKARKMADEFRSSFDEMARQSELDDLRREVEALRTNQNVVRLGTEADEAFRDIRTELNRTDPSASGPPEDEPVMTPLETPRPEGADTEAAAPVESPSAEPEAIRPRSRAAS